MKVDKNVAPVGCVKTIDGLRLFHGQLYSCKKKRCTYKQFRLVHEIQRQWLTKVHAWLTLTGVIRLECAAIPRILIPIPQASAREICWTKMWEWIFGVKIFFFCLRKMCSATKSKTFILHLLSLLINFLLSILSLNSREKKRNNKYSISSLNEMKGEINIPEHIS